MVGTQILCDCNNLALHLVTRKEGPNKGKWFYVCGNTSGAKCDFFRWDETTSRPKKEKRLQFEESSQLPLPEQEAFIKPAEKKAKVVAMRSPDRIKRLRAALIQQAEVCLKAAKKLDMVEDLDLPDVLDE